MANDNTIKSLIYGTLQKNLATLKSSVISTTATAVQLQTNPVTLVGGGVAVLSLGAPGQSYLATQGQSETSAGYQGTGKVLRVKLAGHTTGAIGDEDLTITLYEIPQAIIDAGSVGGALFQDFTGWHALGASTSQAIDAVATNFTYVSDLQLSTTGRLTGQFSDLINSVLDAQAAVTAVAGLVGEQDLNFAVVLKLSTGTTGTVLYLDEFSIEAV